jgi:hypothetical protein
MCKCSSMPELEDNQQNLSLDQRAELLRAEIAEEQRLLSAYRARWSLKNNIVEFKSPRKPLKAKVAGA